MLTRTRAYVGRPQAARRSWLLALVILGIVGMHGLVGGSGTSSGAHHAWAAAPAASVLADASTSSGHDHAVAAVDRDDDGGVTALALCLVLLMALGAGLLAARAGAWPVRLRRVAARVPLPAAPLLRDASPVPRFTVMRC